jgi:hypothetical protein
MVKFFNKIATHSLLESGRFSFSSFLGRRTKKIVTIMPKPFC